MGKVVSDRRCGWCRTPTSALLPSVTGCGNRACREALFDRRMRNKVAAARVLVVEDDDDLREMLALSLRQVGFTVDEAASFKEALTRARKHVPDVMVLDLILRGSTARALELALAEPAFRFLRILPMSGFERLPAGGLQKPFTVETLFAHVGELLQR